eukprot:scaffold37931_cov78-Phaeocystis_antarctica.AAC.3
MCSSSACSCSARFHGTSSYTSEKRCMVCGLPTFCAALSDLMARPSAPASAAPPPAARRTSPAPAGSDRSG